MALPGMCLNSLPLPGPGHRNHNRFWPEPRRPGRHHQCLSQMAGIQQQISESPLPVLPGRMKKNPGDDQASVCRTPVQKDGFHIQGPRIDPSQKSMDRITIIQTCLNSTGFENRQIQLRRIQAPGRRHTPEQDSPGPGPPESPHRPVPGFGKSFPDPPFSIGHLIGHHLPTVISGPSRIRFFPRS